MLGQVQDKGGVRSGEDDRAAAQHPLRHLSLFTGIGGFDIGFERAGMETVGQVEIDRSATTVLERHWPDVPRWKDVNDVHAKGLCVRFAGTGNGGSLDERNGDIAGPDRPDVHSPSGSSSRSSDSGGGTCANCLPDFDVLTGGFPCQDISVAGKRAGLAGDRSGLWYEYARIIAECRPTWVVIENVAGLLSSNRGRDMGAILGTLALNGYGFAYRVLDAQWFGVAQRRRRVFIVGHLGGDGASEVLAVGQGSAGDSPPSRQAREVSASLSDVGLAGYSNADADDFLVPAVANVLTRRMGKGVNSSLDEGQTLVPFQSNEGSRGSSFGELPTLRVGGHSGNPPAILKMREGSPGGGKGPLISEDKTFTLSTMPSEQTLFSPPQLRRLTPVECARLQGFPDDWNDHLSDSARYKQFGNAVCVNVVEWIGRRIAEAAAFTP